MVCRRCNRDIPANYSSNNCPFCNAPLNRGYKSKFVKSDKIQSSGTNVANRSFINLKKKEQKKEILLKDYNSYIDYKTAKEKEEEKKNSKYYNVYSKKNASNNTGAKNSKAKYVRGRKKEESNTNPKQATSLTYSRKPSIDSTNNETSLATFSNQERSSYNEVGRPINNPTEFVSQRLDNTFPVENANYQQDVVYEVPVQEMGEFQYETVKKKSGIGRFFFAVCFVSFVLLIALFVYKSYANNGYYFGKDRAPIVNQGVITTTTIDDEMLQYKGVSKSGQTGGQSGTGVTSIVYDNQYLEQMTFNNINDVLRLIASDSNRQKENCLPDVVAVENEIISKYGLTAVNFCEMDVDFAKELRDVVAFIYNNFPSSRNYLTNITLANIQNASYIAAFMPIFTFGTSNNNTKYPIAIKSQIILNAKYFLNNGKIKSSVSYGVKSGYFPPNATRASTIAHEFGHYLSYIALCNHYKSGRITFVRASEANIMFDVYEDFNAGRFSYQLLREAHEKYKATYRNGLSFDDFRKSISGYAVAKDKSGAYIYDETIAEAFHDCYLNGNMAQPASQAVVDVLMSYL